MIELSRSRGSERYGACADAAAVGAAPGAVAGFSRAFQLVGAFNAHIILFRFVNFVMYLREHGVIPPGAPPEPDEREPVLNRWVNARAGDDLPRPWLKERWKDRTWAAAQICSRTDRLSIEQVEAIRALSKSHSAAEISERIGARGAEQVQRVIDGRTYERVGA